MAIDEDIAFLERIALFRLIGRPALRILAMGAENVYVHTGETLFKKGDAADGAFIVQEGAFFVSKEDGERDILLGQGTVFDELALITDSERAVTAKARDPSAVMRISRSLFIKTLQGHPDAARRIRDALATRVTASVFELNKLGERIATPDSLARDE